MHSPSAVSLVCLVVAYAFVFGAICIIRVPDAQAASFYLMSFEYLMSLSVAVMLVSGVECLVRSVSALVGYYIERGAEEKNRVLISYYTKAEKSIDEEAKFRAVMTKSYLEVCDNMQTLMKNSAVKMAAAASDYIAATTQRVDSGRTECSDSDRMLVISRHATDSEVSSTTFPNPKREVASPSSEEEGSSICSAARTE